MTGYANAIGMLHSRVTVLRDYVLAAEAGEVPADQAILRQISGLCSRLPCADAATFHQVLQKDTNDTMLIAYLAAVTKGCDAIGQMLERFHAVYEKPSSVRRAPRFL